MASARPLRQECARPASRPRGPEHGHRARNPRRQSRPESRSPPHSAAGRPPMAVWYDDGQAGMKPTRSSNMIIGTGHHATVAERTVRGRPVGAASAYCQHLRARSLAMDSLTVSALILGLLLGLLLGALASLLLGRVAEGCRAGAGRNADRPGARRGRSGKVGDRAGASRGGALSGQRGRGPQRDR